MKDVSHYLDAMKLHAPNVDCDIDRGSGRSGATDQDIPSVPKPTPSPEHVTVANYTR